MYLPPPGLPRPRELATFRLNRLRPCASRPDQVLDLLLASTGLPPGPHRDIALSRNKDQASPAERPRRAIPPVPGLAAVVDGAFAAALDASVLVATPTASPAAAT